MTKQMHHNVDILFDPSQKMVYNQWKLQHSLNTVTCSQQLTWSVDVIINPLGYLFQGRSWSECSAQIKYGQSIYAIDCLNLLIFWYKTFCLNFAYLVDHSLYFAEHIKIYKKMMTFFTKTGKSEHNYTGSTEKHLCLEWELHSHSNKRNKFCLSAY
mgnify:CR=1 FL=1